MYRLYSLLKGLYRQLPALSEYVGMQRWGLRVSNCVWASRGGVGESQTGCGHTGTHAKVSLLGFTIELVWPHVNTIRLCKG